MQYLYLLLDMEPPTCPESISEPPRIHIWQSHVGLPKLAISRRYYKIFFRTFFWRNPPPIGPLEFHPRAKSYFRWSSTYQLFQKSSDYKTIFSRFLRVFWFFELFSSEFYQNPLFHFKPSGSHFTETLFQTSTPCRVPSKELISWDFRPWKSAGGGMPQTCAAPAPTCAGIKYPVRGNPSLW